MKASLIARAARVMDESSFWPALVVFVCGALCGSVDRMLVLRAVVDGMRNGGGGRSGPEEGCCLETAGVGR